MKNIQPRQNTLVTAALFTLKNWTNQFQPARFHPFSFLQHADATSLPAQLPKNDVVLFAHHGNLPTPALRNEYGGDTPSIELVPNEQLAEAEGKYKYCVIVHQPDGRVDLLAARNTSGAHEGMRELARTMGFDVVSAGHIYLARRTDGRSEVIRITNTSGHLQPEGTYEQQELAEHVFNRLGLDATGKYQVYYWHSSLQRYLGKQSGEPPAGVEIRQTD